MQRFKEGDPEEDTPGPGNYADEVKVPRPVEPFSSCFVAGRNGQDYYVANENPGPASYNNFKSVRIRV